MDLMSCYEINTDIGEFNVLLNATKENNASHYVDGSNIIGALFF